MSVHVGGRGPFHLTRSAASAPSPPPFPVWLPQAPSGDRPTVYADPVNGHYWYDGAEGTADGIFADPSKIADGVGFVLPEGEAPSGFTGGAATALLSANWTVVVTAIKDGNDDVFTLQNGDDSCEIDFGWSNDGTTIGGGLGEYNDADSRSADLTSLNIPYVPGSVTMAGTRTVAKDVCSFQGSAIAANTTPLTSTTTVTQAWVGPYSGGTASVQITLEQIAIYAPQPDADLPTLSAP